MLYAGGLFYPKVQGQLGLKKIFERLVNLILDEDGLKDMEPTERLSLMEEMADRFKAAPPLVSHCEVCDQIDRKAKSINWPLLQCRECFKGFHSYCLKEQKKYQVTKFIHIT